MTPIQLRYYCHCIQKDSCLERDIMLGMMEGRGRRGRPWRRWLDTVEKDLQLELSAAKALCRDSAGEHQFIQASVPTSMVSRERETTFNSHG